MALDTVILQGRYTSDGTAEFINLRGGVDWFYTYNETTLSAAGAGTVVKAYWQRGMADNTAWIYTKTAVTDALVLDVTGAGVPGFLPFNADTSPVAGPAIATTAITNFNNFTVATGNTAGLSDGDTVRLSSTAAVPNIMGFDYSVDNVVANTSFRIANPISSLPGAVGGAGFYRRINVDSPFYPRRRFIVAALAAGNVLNVRTSVNHGLTVGQDVRFIVPPAFGMVQLNGLLGTVITVVSPSVVTVNIDASAFTAFRWGSIASWPFTFAQLVPVGEDTGAALVAGADILADSTVNQMVNGMIIGAGAGSPGGVNADVIYWVAGSSFSVLNM